MKTTPATGEPQRPELEGQLRQLIQFSLQTAPEEMLEKALCMCIELAGADGGSILGEEGPHLQFLHADRPELIGMNVPWDSIAGVTASRSVVIYTYAPTDRRHFAGVDSTLASQTHYLLSIPIPSIHRRSESSGHMQSSGVLQLLFHENVLPDVNVADGAVEFNLDFLRQDPLYEQSLKRVFWILPNISFGMEVINLRRTSYQVIHELKNKLIAAESWLNCLHEDLEQEAPELLQSPDIQEDFELARTAADEGSELAKNYLQFTKIYTPNFAETDIDAVLHECVASIRAFAAAESGRQDSLQVVEALANTEPPRQLDANQLKMAFFNLLKNAAEVLLTHAVAAPVIRVSSACHPDKLVVTVADNGPGMPPTIADQLFVPFKTKKEGGTGLGLVITKKIIEVHGGSIRCETSPAGTIFTVIL